MACWLLCLLASLAVTIATVKSTVCSDFKGPVADGLPEGLRTFSLDGFNEEAEVSIVYGEKSCEDLKNMADTAKYTARTVKVTTSPPSQADFYFSILSRIELTERAFLHTITVARDGDSTLPKETKPNGIHFVFKVGLEEVALYLPVSYGFRRTILREVALIKAHIKDTLKRGVSVVVDLRADNIRPIAETSEQQTNYDSFRGRFISQIKKELEGEQVGNAIFLRADKKVVSAALVGPNGLTRIRAMFTCEGAKTLPEGTIKSYLGELEISIRGSAKDVRMYPDIRTCSEAQKLCNAGEKAYGFGATVLVTSLEPTSKRVEGYKASVYGAIPGFDQFSSSWSLNLKVPSNKDNPGAHLTVAILVGVGFLDKKLEFFMNVVDVKDGYLSADAFVALTRDQEDPKDKGFKKIAIGSNVALVFPPYVGRDSVEAMALIQWSPSCKDGKGSGSQEDPVDDKKYKVASYNLLDFGLFKGSEVPQQWNEFETKADKIAKVLEGNDIIMLQEVHSCMDLEHLVSKLGNGYKGYMLPVPDAAGRLTLHNVAIVSKVTVAAYNVNSCAATTNKPTNDVLSKAGCLQHGTPDRLNRCISVDVDIGIGNLIRFVSVHFKSGRDHCHSRLAQAAALQKQLASGKNPAKPTIVFGDFNDRSEGFSEYMTKLKFTELVGGDRVDKGFSYSPTTFKIENPSIDRLPISDHPLLTAIVKKN